MLRASNAKVSWQDICSKKCEGGLGIRNLKEVNKVYGLKLIWRMLAGVSLWSKWIHNHLLKGKSFWEIRVNTQMGSWMWRKMLKLRDLAKTFYKKELGNGRHISFWFDNWSTKGVLVDLLGDRGVIDMGVNRNATVEEAVMNLRRRRRHRMRVLNEIEGETTSIASSLNPEKEDINLWKRESGYREHFSTQETWEILREKKLTCSWVKGV